LDVAGTLGLPRSAFTITLFPKADQPALAATTDPHVIRFDGIGEFTLHLTAKDLRATGYTNEGNMYEGMDAACVHYGNKARPLGFKVESSTGRVLAIENSGGDQSLRTQVGGIRVGSTLAQLRKVFAGYKIEEHFDMDFGQGTNGVIVSGAGGSIGFSLADGPRTDYTSGRATITFLNGVGLPDHAPTSMEDGC
jgi:hypothetical protein